MGVVVGVIVGVAVGDGMNVGSGGWRVGVLLGAGIQTNVGVVVCVGAIVCVGLAVAVGFAASAVSISEVAMSAAIVPATIVSISPGAKSVPTIGAFAVVSASIVANKLADTSVLVPAT